MTARIDSLLAELESRYPNTNGFVASLRPVANKILDRRTPEELRPTLLEMLAETCDRHVQIQRNSAGALSAWSAFAEELQRLLQRREF